MTYVVNAHLRAPTEEDLSFIYSSWLKSFRGTSAWAREVEAKAFYSGHKKVITRILEDAGVLVAVNPESHDQIFGYIVFSPTSAGIAVLHYVYVKGIYRKLGIARDLFRAALRIAEHDDQYPPTYSHHTHFADFLRPKWKLVYNPYVIGALFHGEETYEPKAC